MDVIRPMGAFERALYWHNKTRPAHFSFVVELSADVGADDLRDALAALQDRHPLLGAAIADDSLFVRPSVVTPIPLTVVEDGRTWAEVADGYLAEPIGTASAPLARAALLRATDAAPAAIVFTVDHCIADGRSVVSLMRDLFAALNGTVLEPLSVPQSVESRVAGAGIPLPENLAPPEVTDPRLFAVAEKIPFGSAPYEITSVTFDEEQTARLVARARQEKTTVHAAIVAAVGTVLASDYARVYFPVDVRQHLGSAPGSGLYLVGTRMGFAAEDVTGLWEMARHVTPVIAAARSAEYLAGTCAALSRFVGPGFDSAQAEMLLSGPNGFEAAVSNLGVVDLGVPAGARVRPVSVIAPVMASEAGNSQNLSVATFEGRLRLVNVTAKPIPGLLKRLRDLLAA